MKKYLIIVVLVLVLRPLAASADEGMWMVNALSEALVQKMQKTGLELGDAENGYLIRMPNGQTYSGADFASDTRMFSDMYDKINTYEEKDEEYHFLQMQFNKRIADERTAKDIYFIVFDPFRNSALDTAEFREDEGYKRNI